jgi:hypothetical protein
LQFEANNEIFLSKNLKTTLPVTHDLYGYIFKQAFNAYLMKGKKEPMNFSDYFKVRLDKARSINKIDMKLKAGNYMF